jgi:alpha-aminoadipate carrier protein LysW
LQTRAHSRYNPGSYRDRARPAGFWHVTIPIAKPHAGPDRAEETMATCPECDAEIEVDEFDVDKGDQLSCPECGSNLEVTSLTPLELDLAAEDDDDDDDDDDDVEEVDGEEAVEEDDEDDADEKEDE